MNIGLVIGKKNSVGIPGKKMPTKAAPTQNHARNNKKILFIT